MSEVIHSTNRFMIRIISFLEHSKKSVKNVIASIRKVGDRSHNQEILIGKV
jgi:hypothetical protein